MIVYELMHLFHYENDLLFVAPISLGFYSSLASAQDAISYYLTLPGFAQNPHSFLTKQRTVATSLCVTELYEALIYYHTKDYEGEYSVELGLYTDESTAQEAILLYNQNNKQFICPAQLYKEEIINKCILDKKEWSEGFAIDE